MPNSKVEQSAVKGLRDMMLQRFIARGSRIVAYRYFQCREDYLERG